MAAPAAQLSFSGAALAEILACCGAAEGDYDGILFSRAARPPAPAPLPSFFNVVESPTVPTSRPPSTSPA